MKKGSLLLLPVIILFFAGYVVISHNIDDKNKDENIPDEQTSTKVYEVGDIIDAFNNVYVYYNGNVNSTWGDNIADDGYNLGLKYQCVEFIKRYYYECFSHKMPVEHGYAKDFFNREVRDSYLNKERNLYQYKNPSYTKPKTHDIIVFDATPQTPFGHVAIITRVKKDCVEFIQQNPGPYGNSRGVLPLVYKNKCWQIVNKELLGWLRKPKYDDLN